jgi:hypothetical protein
MNFISVVFLRSWQIARNLRPYILSVCIIFKIIEIILQILGFKCEIITLNVSKPEVNLYELQ